MRTVATILEVSIISSSWLAWAGNGSTESDMCDSSSLGNLLQLLAIYLKSQALIARQPEGNTTKPPNGNDIKPWSIAPKRSIFASYGCQHTVPLEAVRENSPRVRTAVSFSTFFSQSRSW